MAYFIAYASCFVVDQFGSAGLKVCKVTSTNFFPLPASCIMMTPHMSLASVVSVNSQVKSVNGMTGGEESHFLIFFFLKALLTRSAQINGLLALFSL